MTDREKYEELLKSFGLEPEVEETTNEHYGKCAMITLTSETSRWTKEEEWKAMKVVGYPHLYASFIFDTDGKFVKVDIAE